MRIAAVLALVAAVVSSTAGAATMRARVELTATQPATVAGTGFHSRERITVTLTTTDVYRKVVVASARGAFTLKFTGAKIAYCASYFVRAKGNRGSLAILKVVPECPSGGPAG